MFIVQTRVYSLRSRGTNLFQNIVWADRTAVVGTLLCKATIITIIIPQHSSILDPGCLWKAMIESF